MRYPILLSLIGLLGYVLVLQWQADFSVADKNVTGIASLPQKSPPTASASRNQGAEKVGVTELPLQSIAQYNVILERPIFFADRRLPKPKPQKTQPVVAKPVRRLPQQPRVIPPFNGKVHGIVIIGQTQKALLSKPGEQASWFERNDKIDGWTIEKIRPGSLILRQGGLTKQLNLHDLPP